MSFSDHLRLADALLPAVLAAGHIEMQHFAAGVVVETKLDASPVTVADREAEAVLLEALHRVAPDVPVVAEERASEGIIPDVGATFFLVDPLDGTRDFIAGRPDFTVNIGLIEHAKPVFGMVYVPARGLLFLTTGDSEAGSAVVSPESGARSVASLGLQPIRTREPDCASLLALASPRHRIDEVDRRLSELGVVTRTQIGSSFKFCLIARGDADIYLRLGSISEWDTAAGHAILAAAGGAVTQLDGAELSYGKVHDRFLNPDFVAWGRPSLAERFISAR